MEGERLNSGLLEVARYAGQTVGLYFGYTGGESTNAVATPEGIFFYRAAARELHARRQGQSVVVTWTVPAASTACGAIEIGPLGAWEFPVPEHCRRACFDDA